MAETKREFVYLGQANTFNGVDEPYGKKFMLTNEQVIQLERLGTTHSFQPTSGAHPDPNDYPAQFNTNEVKPELTKARLEAHEERRKLLAKAKETPINPPTNPPVDQPPTETNPPKKA